MSNHSPSKVISINVLLTLTFLLAVEVSVRIIHPEINAIGTDSKLIDRDAFGGTSGPQPGAMGFSNGVVRKVDERGFWKYSSDRQANGRTDWPSWLFLGDSVTMGLGVEADSTFVGRLYEAQDRFQILNLSVSGHSSNDYLNIFTTLVERERIERVSLFWCLNDVMAGIYVRSAPQGTIQTTSKVVAWMRRYWFTYQWIKATFSDRPRSYFVHDSQFYSEGSIHLDTAVDHLRKIKNLSDSLGIQFDVFLLPYEYGLRIDDEHPQDAMKSRLESEGVILINTANWLRTSGNIKNMYLYGDGIHFSSQGHQVIAQGLRSYYGIGTLD